MSVTLCRTSGSDLSVSIDAYFSGKDLVIDGCDTGTMVMEHYGDYDYEYKTTVPAKKMHKVYKALKVEFDNEDALLKKIQENFTGIDASSMFRSFLSREGIHYDTFDWA